jgi:predicted RNA-binding Zn ribbon-like protein
MRTFSVHMLERLIPVTTIAAVEELLVGVGSEAGAVRSCPLGSSWLFVHSLRQRKRERLLYLKCNAARMSIGLSTHVSPPR